MTQSTNSSKHSEPYKLGDEADKLDTIVQLYPTNERNTVSQKIEEESLESVFSKIVEEKRTDEPRELLEH